jgi:hypothetical protein
MANTHQPGRNPHEAGSTTERAKEAATSMADKGREMAGNVGERAREAASTVADRARDAASSVASGVREAASTAADRARQAASAAGKTAEEYTGRVGSGMEQLAGTIRESAPTTGYLGGAAATVADTLESGGRYLQEEGLSGMASDLTEMIKRNPIPALLVGIGIGFLLARATSPRS